MKKKVAQYIADFLIEHGVTDMFTITGGGAMHLNDAFGHALGLHCTYNHHEQACAMAAEGYARLTGKIAAVCVTSGPGGTNAITGVVGGWQDSIPMFIISGQVKRETTTWSTDIPLRQLGDQEFQIVDCVKTMTKYAHMITVPEEIRYHLEKAWFLCQNGRPGPVWLDIPLDVQAAMIETEELKGFEKDCKEEYQALYEREKPVFDRDLIPVIIEKIKQAKRPVLFGGTGIRLSGAYNDFLALVQELKIPVVTAWNAHDLLWEGHPYDCGRPGTVGTRGGNFTVQCSDLLLVIGCRLNIRQISYNYKEFAHRAYKIIVDIDEAELHKPTVKADLPVHGDAAQVIPGLTAYLREHQGAAGDHQEWLSWCKDVNKKYPAVLSAYYEKKDTINPYVFVHKLTGFLTSQDVIVCGNGSACVIGFQAARLKKGQRIFTNSGCAAMGYGFPAAVGCALAQKGKRIICLDGDGSFQMNMQELQTVVYNHLNVKLFIINNNGYHSIRQTQMNLFEPPLVGVCDGNGLSMPSFEKLAAAYEIPYVRVKETDLADEAILKALSVEGPVLCEAIVDETQNFEPKLSSRVLPDGTIVSPEIDDMFPFLPREEYEAVHNAFD